MKRLLQEASIKVTKSEEKKLGDKELANLKKRYRAIVTRSVKELPVIPPKPSGSRGKLTKSDAHNLLERFQIHGAAVLLFAKNRRFHLLINELSGSCECPRSSKNCPAA